MQTEIDIGQICVNCPYNCTGYQPHDWRNICRICKCPRDAHDIRFKGYVLAGEKLNLNPVNLRRLKMDTTKKYNILNRGYSWQPPALTSDEIEAYFSQYPKDLVPKLGTFGEKYREKALMNQMPKQDIDATFCKHVKDDNAVRRFEQYLDERNCNALDVGICHKHEDFTQKLMCRYCQEMISLGTIFVRASAVNNDQDFDDQLENLRDNIWHPSCFRCFKCDELLIDLVYCMKNNRVYCVRHYGETCKPRCAACDELIFNSEYTKGMNQNFHTEHFSCWNCETSLTGSRYILKDEHPYCIKCYEELFAHACEECKKKIGTDSKDLSYKDRHWHEKCFFCHVCKLPLVDKPFGTKNDALYCAECYNQAFASRCDKCAQIFKPGMKKMEYKGQQFHENCFLCFTCNQPIGTKSFIPKENKIYCVPCYENNFATKCTKCTKVISQGGVTYKNQPYHRECFNCTNCQQSLAGQRFTSRDDHPYCSECFGKLFAKKCYSCHKPITGIGGTKYISFEDRHWHNDCFVCNKCHSSLVGRGFLTDAMDILCPDCGRN